MSLVEYKRKRHFQKTPEPTGKAAKSPRGKGLRFVVQKHDASRLHYDFRLELNGVLKSWAVPKGPSLDPTEKRLAVEVEDHPLDYGGFEGTIPEGEYGAGEVIVWDRGTWTPEGDAEKSLRAGNLKFELRGEKLNGQWALIRIRGKESKPNWLLIKKRDEFARATDEGEITEVRPESVKSGRRIGDAASVKKRMTKKMSKGDGIVVKSLPGARKAPPPHDIDPQLATLHGETPRGDEWLHEIKFDGYRMICHLDHGRVRLMTRNHQDWTHRYEAVAAELRELPADTAILDGEIVALLESGISNFQALQNAGKNGAATALAYYAFDLLYLDGYDLRRVPLEQRKEALQALLNKTDPQRVRLSEHFDDDGPAFFRQCCQMGLEGVISKRRGRPSVAGRSDDWIKTKCVAREELVVGGYSLSSAMTRGIGALLVGYYQDGELIYAGRVGTGFSNETLLSLRARLEKLKAAECPFATVPARERRKEVRWVEPQLVAQVEFTGWTDDAILRHPSFQGLREDKPAKAVTRPQSLSPITKKRGAELMAKKRSAKATTAARNDNKSTRGTTTLAGLPKNSTVQFTNPDRMLFPDIGITKLGLATYYAQVAKWMLPHVVDRPLSLVRCPEGQSGKCFFQKHAVASTPKALRRIEIQEKNEAETYVTVGDLDGLLAIAQMSVLEIHIWGSRRDRIEQPDRLIIDLDPDERVPWSRVIDAALEVRDALSQYELESFVKTTGGKGLHVVVPIAPRRPDWEAAKKFCRHLADQLVAENPQEYIATMSKAARKGKIFIDYLRNDRGATAIAPFSTRAKPGAPVSVPLAWEELSPALKSNHFDVNNVLGRLESLSRDPWEKIDEIKQTIPKVY